MSNQISYTQKPKSPAIRGAFDILFIKKLPFHGKVSLVLVPLSVQGIVHAEPVIARRQRVPVVGAVPSRARGAQLFEQFPEPVEDIDLGTRVHLVHPYEVPGVVVAIAVGRKVGHVVQHPDGDGHAAAASFIPDGDGVRPGRYVLEDGTVLEGAVVELELIAARPGGPYLDGMAVGEGQGDLTGTIGERWRGHHHRGGGPGLAAGGQVRYDDRILPWPHGCDRWAVLARQQHPVEHPLKGIQVGIQPGIDQGPPAHRVAVGIHAEGVLFLQEDARQLVDLEDDLHDLMALGLVNIVLVGDPGIDHLRVDGVHEREHDGLDALDGLLHALVVGQGIDQRGLAAKDFVPEVHHLLDAEILEVELRKAIAWGKVVADLEWLGRGRGHGALLYDQLKALYPADSATAVAVRYPGIDHLRVLGGAEPVAVPVLLHVLYRVGAGLRINWIQVEGHLEVQARLKGPQDLGYLFGKVEQGQLRAELAMDKGADLRTVVRQRVYDKQQLHDLKAAGGGIGGPHIDGLRTAGVRIASRGPGSRWRDRPPRHRYNFHSR